MGRLGRRNPHWDSRLGVYCPIPLYWDGGGGGYISVKIFLENILAIKKVSNTYFLCFFFLQEPIPVPKHLVYIILHNKLTFLSENVIKSYVFLKGFAKKFLSVSLFFIFHSIICINSYLCHFFTVYIWNIKFSTRFVLNFSLCYVQFVPYCTVLKYFSMRHALSYSIDE